MSGTSASFNLPNGTNILQRINSKIQGARSLKKPKYESDGLYKPLKVERREIRLLHMEPSLKLKEQPQCFLETVSLDDSPQFEALSYVWGDPNLTRPIRLGNRQWYATINLEAGLRYLRRPFEDIVIWVDALCIDQSSVDERNSQVLLMKTIYSNATQVKVWLGEPTSRSDDALAILEHMGRNIPFRDIRLHGKNLNYKHAKYLNELVNRPWWNRVWVQQEYSLAKDVTLHCGLRSIEFSGLLKNEDIDRLCKGWDMRLYITMQTLGHSALLHRQHHCTGANDLTFTGILAQGCYKDCSDLRDSIYGFLGLAKEDVVDAIKPDYGIPLEDVLRCTAVTHITCTRSLSFFSFSTLKSKDTRLGPTWVPEWPRLGPFQLRERYGSAQNQKRTVWDHRVNRFESILDFKACATRSMSFDLINETTVMLNGKCTGEVTEVNPVALRCESKTSAFIHPDVIRLLENWLNFFDQFADHAAFPSSTEGRESPLWRILTGDRHLDRRGRWRNCEKTDYEAYQAFQRDLVAGGALIEGELNCWVSITVASADRCLFATDRGHIGLGPLEMRKGDHVYILSGGEVPYMLRPVSGPIPRTFELVGDCYLHGIMYGEAAGPDEDFHDVYLE
ncbi:hypothetical protein JMJ35_008618 [Cladonia borealis]|uniref:Heterokaryon incompatibility domain-containing protein n=1 Tax=Cladonia borealis TaxID=184061 RepID=A0AA39UZ28_9LECA|nr:hypothetical protein JMJ35_008618 [Cladonia borealis]